LKLSAQFSANAVHLLCTKGAHQKEANEKVEESFWCVRSPKQ